MKQTHLLTTLSAALLLSFQSVAQIPGVSTVKKALPKVDLGAKLGSNFQQLDGSISKSYNGGVVGGIFLGVHKNRMGVQAEALIKKVNYNVYTPNTLSMPPINTYTAVTVNTVSLEVPVLFEYRLFWHIWGQVGPEFSSLLSAKDHSNNYQNQFNSQDFAGVIGLEAHLPMRLNIGVRYVYGVTDINKESVSGFSNALHNRTIQAYIGFRFI